MKAPNINDVAAHAGVSKKTVSRVINNESNVREQTRKKVQDSIAALGFKRSPLGLALAKSRSFFIALLSDNPSPGYVNKLQQGILQSCTESKMGLFLYDCKYRSPTLVEDISHFIDSTLVDGVILPPPLCDNQPLIDMLNSRNLAYVSIGSVKAEHQHYVSFNYEKAACEVTRYLLKMGHRDIAFIKGHPDQQSSMDKERGFKRALSEQGVDVNESLITQGFYTFQSGKDAATILLSQDLRPTAIISSNDEMAVGVLHELHYQKLSVPGDISVVGMDDISIASKVFPSLTTYRQPLGSIGYKAATILINKLTQKEKGEKVAPDIHAIFDGELVIRDSVAPPNT
ncbi:LacI family DNA-binding transcriptional regulator [Aestuariibacter sp. A3R04]|uniref:LacI family DNA-binding transcriptional regulator n=1 Tax=Aestuariibacter sp. A3R04 TaxID=2841571 RepID=UPI001C09E6F4|nr:LacI family DNA-binding transcriptional regulator [Aestuariibacter sp. A3R04]MBU3022772.1 LacI family DNA-binding transcriptional regulator [Aestuariibacter sp. A3R04]